MTNGNEEPRIYIRIGEPTHNVSTSDHTTRGDANRKGGRKAYLEFC